MSRNLILIPLLLVTAITGLTACHTSRKVATVEKKQPAQPLSDQQVRRKYAPRLSVRPSDLGNPDLYRFIDDWYGVPYRYGGNNKGGIDCSGFSTRLYAAVFSKTIQRTAQLQYNSSKRVKRRKLKEGDLVFFNEGRRKITHVGIYLHNAFFVHASIGGGVMISNLDDPYWERHFAGGGRMP